MSSEVGIAHFDEPVVFETTDGHAKVVITDSKANMDADVWTISVVDGGGFSSCWVQREAMLKLRDNLNTLFPAG